MKRCKWCNLNNPIYIEYHDKEWGVMNINDDYLLEMLILESFQAGLSWECVLNKRESFRLAYDNFNIDKICNYTENKIKELSENKDIIRNKLKIKASINNTKIFKSIQKEFGSFSNYLKTFTKDNIIYETDKTLTVKQLFNSGMNVGRDIIGTMSNTLILVYLGSSLPLVLLSSNIDLNKFFNLNQVATEILSALIGSIAILFCVPITAIVAAYLIKKSNENKIDFSNLDKK